MRSEIEIETRPNARYSRIAIIITLCMRGPAGFYSFSRRVLSSSELYAYSEIIGRSVAGAVLRREDKGATPFN